VARLVRTGGCKLLGWLAARRCKSSAESNWGASSSSSLDFVSSCFVLSRVSSSLFPSSLTGKSCIGVSRIFLSSTLPIVFWFSSLEETGLTCDGVALVSHWTSGLVSQVSARDET
jgi:hypothetical protein